MDKQKNSLNNNERKLKYPCIYRHFKGKYYATMGLSKAIDSNYIEKICETYNEKGSTKNKIKYKLDVKHTELDENIFIYRDLNGNFYHQKEKDNNDLVLYKTLYDDTGVFSRPLDMFLSKVDRDRYFNPIQEYRFEEFYK